MTDDQFNKLDQTIGMARQLIIKLAEHEAGRTKFIDPRVGAAIAHLETFNDLMGVLTGVQPDMPPVVARLHAAIKDVVNGVADTLTVPMGVEEATDEHLAWMDVRNMYLERAEFEGLALLGHLSRALAKDPSLGQPVSPPDRFDGPAETGPDCIAEIEPEVVTIHTKGGTLTGRRADLEAEGWYEKPSGLWSRHTVWGDAANRAVDSQVEVAPGQFVEHIDLDKPQST